MNFIDLKKTRTSLVLDLAIDIVFEFFNRRLPSVDIISGRL